VSAQPENFENSPYTHDESDRRPAHCSVVPTFHPRMDVRAHKLAGVPRSVMAEMNAPNEPASIHKLSDAFGKSDPELAPSILSSSSQDRLDCRRGTLMSRCFFPVGCAIGFAFIGILFKPVALASESCPHGQIRCATGTTSSGGCFDPAVSACQDGLICDAPLGVCMRGAIGPGTCFRPDRFTCDSGRLRALSYVAPQARVNVCAFKAKLSEASVRNVTGSYVDIR
jgi:hypothetical protein